ncbi:PREDICTED: cinnamoyl-CoA reductase 1-like isoform X1 [Ipomoea nil]|uniref:cinnamoyl-CoA reductase 1-like isoform X1 n=1 Tax=Ipomoea nil TaxID=35883 RepID=UPI0009013CD1|nr:PREDICTED: cinnamoyl-CoA reductase 1-like isoform X1 [Ipomoea nil]
MSGEGKVVCVTGASGFIASWLVKLLLHRGYTVHATVRCLKDPNKVSHLLALDGAKERLHLFEADLVEENSFDDAINGCEGVFHTASPVSFSPSATKRELVDPAVKGTLNVLGSCVRTPCVKKVVVTSSTASIFVKRNLITPTEVVDETWFSDKEFAEETKQWYILSKILAEEAAWKYAWENGIDMVSLHPCLVVSLHPCLVIGPILQPTLNFSTKVILDLIKEEKDFFPGINCYVDARDVVNAHIQAFEVPSARGRYLLIGETIHFSQVLKIAGQLYPSLPIPDKYKGDLPVMPTFKASQKKAKSLGINFTSFAVTLKDTIESLKEKNLLSF